MAPWLCFCWQVAGSVTDSVPRTRTRCHTRRCRKHGPYAGVLERGPQLAPMEAPSDLEINGPAPGDFGSGARSNFKTPRRQ